MLYYETHKKGNPLVEFKKNNPLTTWPDMGKHTGATVQALIKIAKRDGKTNQTMSLRLAIALFDKYGIDMLTYSNPKYKICKNKDVL